MRKPKSMVVRYLIYVVVIAILATINGLAEVSGNGPWYPETAIPLVVGIYFGEKGWLNWFD